MTGASGDLTVAKLVAILGLVLWLVGAGNLGLAAAGIALYVVGMYMLGSRLGANELFKYALVSGVAGFVGGAVAWFALLSLFFGIGLLTLFIALLALLVAYAFLLVMGWFKRRLMALLQPYTDASVAGWCGRLYWWGAILTLVLVGFIVLLIAVILEIVAIALVRSG